MIFGIEDTFLFSGEDASLHSGGSLSPSADNVANELQGLTLEEQERQKAEWASELAKVNTTFFILLRRTIKKAWISLLSTFVQ